MTDKLNVHSILDFKKRGEQIAALTAYDYSTAKFLDRAGIDLLLVGDSMNMVVFGEPSTLTLRLEAILPHVRAVASAAKRAFVVGDLPFMSYQPSVRDAVISSGEMIRAGAQAVKLEGGRAFREHVEAITDAGIPVMGHLGMTPQSVHKFGGYRLIGKGEIEAERLIDAAVALEDAGVFSIVLEKIPADLSARVAESVEVPIIGIGAGKHCDGQILVTNDLLGLFDEFKPKFVRRYAQLNEIMIESVGNYVSDVKDGSFPSDEESYK
ncbi:MAG TPA: 3-methyl-2-oxobutanoate hydroxymethyltransferase [candidate division Zixibacteria bacterium]|nr:3-methyl-2-oxobutanoate hydroxymethyltransferase [candidate division Zixibacteria bacterium]